MHTTDPIADMLTRIRNANSAKHETVEIPASNLKKEIAQILVDEGYIKSYNIIDDGKQGVIKVILKYGQNKAKVIQGIKRVSKPGLRIYVGKEEIEGHERPRLAIVSHFQRHHDDRGRDRTHRRRSSRVYLVIERKLVQCKNGRKTMIYPQALQWTCDAMNDRSRAQGYSYPCPASRDEDHR